MLMWVRERVGRVFALGRDVRFVLMRLWARLAVRREAGLRRRRGVLCAVPVMMAGPVRRLGGDPWLGLLTLEIAFHLLESEVWRRVYGAESNVRGRGLLPGLRDALTLANHSVLEVTDLHDALPVGAAAPRELGRLKLEQMGIEGSGTRRE